MEGRDPPGVLAQGPHVPLTSNFQGTLAPSREVLSLSLASSCPPTQSQRRLGPQGELGHLSLSDQFQRCPGESQGHVWEGPGPWGPACACPNLPPTSLPWCEGRGGAYTPQTRSGVGTVVFKLPNVKLAVLAVTSEEKMRRWGFGGAVTGARDYRVLITPTLCRLFWITLPNLPCPTSVSLLSYGKGMTPAPRGS